MFGSEEQEADTSERSYYEAHTATVRKASCKEQRLAMFMSTNWGHQAP